MTAATPRPLRADARRNRDRLLATAVTAFSRDPDVTLDAIAKEAGVGIGTLYRHFPTREALVEAAYRNELAHLVEGSAELLSLPPDEAVRAFLGRCVDFLSTKAGMADALRAVIASGGDPYAESGALLIGAIAPLLEAGAAAGILRADVDPFDLLVATNGVTLAATSREQADRLLDLLFDGLRQR
ncbi:DNA-binding transcriptional regulator, AcrR family [Asanoa hainanensis]|uniref:DNA-binding transcriptional regulator, AcrR family n=1 Tax=Asanoa hainanensis TaxID=560556 RepID=A0A239PBR4_9ACTN|nr:TetR/AcrR family transcriptional regulator [Asanoa hainanensis]SNT64104.1 DNA-binding transcriptional regulator, AcrR family [Asanoa hainanensis]